MPRRLPPAQALHAFEAAARHMSFTEAARELGITQAAVSQRIKLLEHRLGQRLFLRHARGLELTEAGRAFVPAAHEAFERLATGLAEAFGPARDAPLTLRTTPGFAAYWLGRRLRGFQQRHPDISLRLTTAVWPTDFDLEAVDMEVRYGRGDWDGVECLRLTREWLTPVCSPGVAPAVTSPEALAGRTLLHAVGFEIGWPQWLARAGTPAVLDETTALLCDNMAVVTELAVHGAGIGLGRSGFVEALLDEGRLVAPFGLRLETDEAFFLVRAAARSPRPGARRFWSWMEGEAVPAPASRDAALDARGRRPPLR